MQTALLSQPVLPSNHLSGLRPAALGRLAVRALVAEAELTPKPGLVDRRGSGAHHDLSLSLMLASAHTLEPWLRDMAALAQELPLGCELRERLARLGRHAEVAMLEVTRGVNTHRGAIWSLGLLVAACANTGSVDARVICAAAGELAGLPDRFAPASDSHGLRVRQRFGVGGARGEASAGFPHVLRFGLPALRLARAVGATGREARLHALLSLIAHLPDTCLLHRGGQEALVAAQEGARRCLQLGGYATTPGRQQFVRLEAELVRLWASPGGSADLLAATIFLDSLPSATRRTSL